MLVIKYAGPGLVFFTAVTVYSGYATIRGFDSHNSVLELLAPVGAAGGLYMVVAVVRGIVRKDRELREPARGQTADIKPPPADAHAGAPTPADRHRVTMAILRGEPIQPSDRRTAEMEMARLTRSGSRRVFTGAPTAILFAIMGTFWLVEGHGQRRFVTAGLAFAAMAATVAAIRRQDRIQRWRDTYLAPSAADDLRDPGDQR
jgi:O-antigen ligase